MWCSKPEERVYPPPCPPRSASDVPDLAQRHLTTFCSSPRCAAATQKAPRGATTQRTSRTGDWPRDAAKMIYGFGGGGWCVMHPTISAPESARESAHGSPDFLTTLLNDSFLAKNRTFLPKKSPLWGRPSITHVPPSNHRTLMVCKRARRQECLSLSAAPSSLPRASRDNAPGTSKARESALLALRGHA